MNCDHIGLTKYEIEKHIERMRESLGPRYFLYDEQRFQQCKRAVEVLSFVWTRINLAEPAEVQRLSDVLTRHHVELVFMNLTNIHHYCDCDVLKNNINLLNPGQNNCSIMFSCGITANAKSILKTRVDSKRNYFRFMNDTKVDSAFATPLTGVETPDNFRLFRVLSLIEQANQRIAILSHRYLGASKQYAPKITTNSEIESNPSCFFFLEKAKQRLPNDWLFREIVVLFLPACSLKWFVIEKNETQDIIQISYKFLLAFLDQTKDLEPKITQTQDDIRLNRSDLPLFNMATL